MSLSPWGLTPRASVDAACRQRGTAYVVSRCVDILRGGEIDEDTLVALAGPSAEAVLRGEAGGLAGYWPKVWAARGLLYAWDESAAAAATALLAGTLDASWRVREMCAKVVARHRVEDALAAMTVLTSDPNARVRRAADRALIRLFEAEGSDEE